ncbi:hypothetical protein C5B42_00330, partial [Candidatus Cerribacteria bacterium 'Amazon FNV 2010 28 9']
MVKTKIIKNRLFSFFLLFLLCFGGIIFWRRADARYAQAHPSYGFDAQNFELWRWTAQQGIRPYADVFYPYGYLFYYSNTVFFFSILLDSLSAFSLCVLLHRLWKATDFSLVRYVLIGTLLVFLYRFIGFDVWSRYGIALTAALLAPTLIQKKRVIVVLGMVYGLLFGLVQDQSIYAVLVTEFALFFVLFPRNVIFQFSFWRRFFTSSLLLAGSFAVGCIPFFVFLRQSNQV